MIQSGQLGRASAPDESGAATDPEKIRAYFTTSVKKLFNVCGGAPFKDVVNDKV